MTSQPHIGQHLTGKVAISGLSGNEIYCLHQIGFEPGHLTVGNSVHSLGFLGSLGSGLRSIAGGEIIGVTQLIEEGRHTAYTRMEEEAKAHKGIGLTGVTSELVFHGGNMEFLSIGSALHKSGGSGFFSTHADGQELYAQIDAGYHPQHFVLGNVAYSIGLARGVVGGLKTLARGEVREFSEIFNTTRRLALDRIMRDAKRQDTQRQTNAIVGIQTTILPVGLSGFHEMLMIGTAAHNPHLQTTEANKIVTSDLTCQEMWNLTRMGYAPMKLLLGTSVYSLGFVGGLTSFFKSFVKGEIPELSKLVYEARENSLDLIQREAQHLGADKVVGVKTYVHQLGGGLIEFLAIGTAVKKQDGLGTMSEHLPPQAFQVDKDTFVNVNPYSYGVDLNQGR